MTVTIVQDQPENPGEPIVGDVREVITDEHSHPGGILVKLESGAPGRVKSTGESAVED